MKHQQSINLSEAREDIMYRPFRPTGTPTDQNLGVPSPLDGSKKWAFRPLPVLTDANTGVERFLVESTEDLHQFKNKVSSLSDDVIAVQADEGEHKERHVTTFILGESETLRRSIIDVEADIIRSFPEVDYDFHIRVVPKDADDRFRLPEGSYYLLTWQAKA